MKYKNMLDEETKIVHKCTDKLTICGLNSTKFLTDFSSLVDFVYCERCFEQKVASIKPTIIEVIPAKGRVV